jgi:hypothetical protein
MNVVKFPSDKPPVTDADPDDARRAKAYFDMEPHICDVVYMATIAVEVLNHPNRNLHQFAVYRLSEMLDELTARYYAMDFRHEAPATIDQKAQSATAAAHARRLRR